MARFFHDTSVGRALAEHFQQCSTIAYRYSQLLIRRLSSQHPPAMGTPICIWLVNLPGKIPQILSIEHVRPCSMTTSDNLPAATYDQPLALFSPLNDTTATVAATSHSRLLVFLPSSADFPVALRQPTSRRASQRYSLCNIHGFHLSFSSVHTMRLRFNFEFNFEIGLCLVTARAIPIALEKARAWGAAQFNQLSLLINNKPSIVAMGAITRSGAAQPCG